LKKTFRIALMSMTIYCLVAAHALANTVELKTARELFHAIQVLENALPFKKENVERLTGCSLGVDKSPHHFVGLQDREQFFSKKFTDRLVSQVEMIEALQPDKNFQGIVTIRTNKIRFRVSEAEIRSAFGKPDELSDALDMDIPESGQPKSLLYRRKWGLLIFSVSKVKEHYLEDVVLQAIRQPPVIPGNNVR
jgi:hypothetical protein